MVTAVANGVVAGMNKVQASFKALGPAAKQAADQTAQAFKTLNIKSAIDVKAEQNKIIDAFNQIKTSGKASAEDVTRAQDAMQKKLKELQSLLTTTADSSQKASKSFGTIFSGVGMASFYFNNMKTAIQSTWQALLEVSRPAMELEKLNAIFKASSGSAELAAREYAIYPHRGEPAGAVFPGCGR